MQFAVAIYLLAFLSPVHSWIYGFRLCFEEVEGSSQCQGTRSSCSGWSSRPRWTEYYRDDTDGRSGGCTYKWKIEASRPRIGYEYRLCFQETEGSSQCQGTRSSCTGWMTTPGWTAPFRDDTDDRGGGCAYYWKVEQRKNAAVDDKAICRVCFKETEGSSQCQGVRNTCSGWSSAPAWTKPFRDDTDDRGGGCHYSWFLDCIPAGVGMENICPSDTPCS